MDNTFTTVKEAINSLSPEKRLALLNYLEKQINFDQLLTIDLVKSFVEQQKTLGCPHCQSENVISWGKYKNRKRYKCQTCHKTFNDLTGTAFHYLHNHQKVLRFIALMFEQKTLQEKAVHCEICIKTSVDWRHKFMHALNRVLKTQLKDEIQADELFFPLSYKGLANLPETVGREAFKRSTTRPLKSQQDIVLTAIDTHNNIHLVHGGQGTLTKKMVQDAFSKCIRKQRISQKKKTNNILYGQA